MTTTLSKAGGRPDGGTAAETPLDRSDRYLVIGAGPAGLAQARAFKRAGLPFDLLERHSGPGGIWDIENPGTPLYDSARFISSKGRSAFLGHPMPKDYPDYPAHPQVLAYLRRFSETEGLAPEMTVSTAIERLEPAGELWRVQLRGGGQRLYRGVVCASGMTWHPQLPEIPGPFDGEVIHAVNYRSPLRYRGRRILVLGGGNSGCDIACDIAPLAAQTYLSLRRGYHVVPRHVFGLPADVFGAATPWLPVRLQQVLSQRLLRLLQGHPHDSGWPRPDHRIYESHPIINSAILDLTRRGLIEVRPDVAVFEGRTIHFADGSRAEIDGVILASGYKMSLPYLAPEHVDWAEDRIANFLTVFSRRHANLFTLGFLSTNAGVFGDFDRLAHLIAQHLRDQSENPERAAAFRRLVKGPPPDLSGGLRFVGSPRHAVYAHNPAFRRYARRLRRQMKWPAFPG